MSIGHFHILLGSTGNRRLMKKVARFLLLVIISIMVTAPTSSCYTNVASNRNEVWISDSELIDSAQADIYADAVIQVHWEFDYDTEISAALWSVDEGYYVEQVPSTVSGVGSKRYSLPFRTPDTDGVYEYRAETLYKEGEEWVKVEDGEVSFQVEITGGLPPSGIDLSGISLPSLPNLSIPNLPGYVWGIAGLIVGALVMYLYIEYM